MDTHYEDGVDEEVEIGSRNYLLVMHVLCEGRTGQNRAEQGPPGGADLNACYFGTSGKGTESSTLNTNQQKGSR